MHCILCFARIVVRPWKMQSVTRSGKPSDNVGPFCSRDCMHAFSEALVKVGL